jgi:eukaryotic-like serine/threonine-protein kinase
MVVPSATDVGFGSFSLRRLIRCGRVSQTWLATRMSGNTSRRLRVTTLTPGAPLTAVVLERAGALIGTETPHVSRVVELGFVDCTPFIAAECVDGPTVTAILRRLEIAGKPVPRWLVRTVAEACFSAIDLVRAEGLSPIGLHPSNMTLSFSGDVKVSLADEIALDHGVEPAWVGGAGYVSPEEVRGRPLDFAADDYALGVLLHHLLSGAHPRSGCATAAELLLSLLSIEPPNLAATICGVELADSVRAMQSCDPIARAAGRQAARSRLATLPLASPMERATWVATLFAEDAPLPPPPPAGATTQAVEIGAELAEDDHSPAGDRPPLASQPASISKSPDFGS